MTNEQKAKEILNCKNCHIRLKAGGVKCPPECTNFKDLMQMAEWKEQQVIDWLKSYRQDTYDGMSYIPGIVNDKTIEDFKKAMKGK